MQYMLHNGPYSLIKRTLFSLNPFSLNSAWLRQMVRLPEIVSAWRFRSIGERLISSYEIGIKLILIGSVLFGFFQLVTYLLTWSASPLVQIPVLTAWACGVIPLLFRLWWLDLSGEHEVLSPPVDYAELMVLRELLPSDYRESQSNNWPKN